MVLRSSPDRAVRVRALAEDIVLCTWARHFTLTVPLSTQVYKWVPTNLILGVTLRWTSIPSGGVEILLVTPCYRNRDKLRPDGPLESYTNYLFYFLLYVHNTSNSDILDTLCSVV